MSEQPPYPGPSSVPGEDIPRDTAPLVPRYGPAYGPVPLQPSDERTWSVIVHLAPLVALGVLGPLIVWLVFRGRGPFLEHHAKESLNFQLTLLIASVTLGLITLVTLGVGAIVTVPVAIVIAISALVLQIMAAVAAGQGSWYRYPVSWRMVA